MSTDAGDGDVVAYRWRFRSEDPKVLRLGYTKEWSRWKLTAWDPRRGKEHLDIEWDVQPLVPTTRQTTTPDPGS